MEKHLRRLAYIIGKTLLNWGDSVSVSTSVSVSESLSVNTSASVSEFVFNDSPSPSYSNSASLSPSPSEEITDYDHYKATEIMSTVGRNHNFLQGL